MVDIYAILRSIKEYADKNNVPIMMDDGIDFLTTYILKNHVKNVLEIGIKKGKSILLKPKLNQKTNERNGYKWTLQI